MGQALASQFPNGVFVTTSSEAALATESAKLTGLNPVYLPVQHSPVLPGYGPGNQALGGVFIGALYSVTNQSDVFSNNVGVIINCTHDLKAYPAYHKAAQNLKQNLGVSVARLQWADSDTQELELADVVQAVNYIHATRRRGVSVLVHCVMGVSRSATLVLAYMVALEKKSVEECLAVLKEKRECAMPNPNFFRQLKSFEGALMEMVLEELKPLKEPLKDSAAAHKTVKAKNGME
jgi:protein-tyrosine phosphatase